LSFDRENVVINTDDLSFTFLGPNAVRDALTCEMELEARIDEEAEGVTVHTEGVTVWLSYDEDDDASGDIAAELFAEHATEFYGSGPLDAALHRATSPRN
jgi:hypothetical protein